MKRRIKAKVAEAQYCTRCDEKLNESRAVWLELSNTNNQYYEQIPSDHISQGWFIFGSACAKTELKETAKAVTA